MKLIVLSLLLLVPIAANAQTPTAADQARIQPLFEEMKKAQEPYLAKAKALPEEKAVTDALAEVEAAQAKLNKAVEARNKAASKLPEFNPVKDAEAKLLKEVYQILADHKLSSREWQPQINDKGKLAFVKVP